MNNIYYLNLILSNQAGFIVEYNESCQDDLKHNQIDLSKRKIIFVSRAFTDYQNSLPILKIVPLNFRMTNGLTII